MKGYFLEGDQLLIKISATKLYESPSETRSRRINSLHKLANLLSRSDCWREIITSEIVLIKARKT